MYVKTGLAIVEVGGNTRNSLRVVKVARVQNNGKAFKVEGDSRTYSTATGEPYGAESYPFMRNLFSDETPESITEQEAKRLADIEAKKDQRITEEAKRRAAALKRNTDPRTSRLMTANPDRDLYQFTVFDKTGDLHTVMFAEDVVTRTDWERGGQKVVLVGLVASLYHPPKGGTDTPKWNKFEVEGRSHDDLVTEIICKLW